MKKVRERVQWQISELPKRKARHHFGICSMCSDRTQKSWIRIYRPLKNSQVKLHKEIISKLTKRLDFQINICHPNGQMKISLKERKGRMATQITQDHRMSHLRKQKYRHTIQTNLNRYKKAQEWFRDKVILKLRKKIPQLWLLTHRL